MVRNYIKLIIKEVKTFYEGFYSNRNCGNCEILDTVENIPTLILQEKLSREGRKHGALRPQKPLRLIRDGEVGGEGGQEFYTLTPTRYTVTTRMSLH